MGGGQIILCEQQGDWAVALRSIWPAGFAYGVRQTRSLSQARQAAAEVSPALVIIELTPGNGAAVCIFLTELAWHFPAATTVVVAERELASWEPTVREFGAAHFLASRRRLVELAPLVARYATRKSAWSAPSGLLPVGIQIDLPAWAIEALANQH